ncbi:Nonsense-mediated mRNA decay protein 3 [Grifola frondosa]|uniref:Nonsense-mediated mRNA decay protein 3 n=1 Tax=Grifola frondosa TaxID=5627 RepID=A0A1C7LQ74_GRIFR|nr:Nonsense-mediated mRNA decay protein 3 [Grifola frondosa]
MSTGGSAKGTGSPAKPKPKEKKARLSGPKAQSDRLKTVVRRLPPNLPEEVFWQSVQKWVTDDTATWKAYCQGKFRKRLNKENIPSRAYIAFKDEELLAAFSREYDGHLFRDKAGNESVAVVEFAPFQKIPNEKKKLDSRAGTIEKDEDYISFLESLKEVSTKPFDADTLETLAHHHPLLEALKAEKSAQKDKEAILRNHAHYKDQLATAGPATARKEDGKKKGAAPPPAPKPTEPPVSKKAAKRAAAAAKAAQPPLVQQPAAKPVQAAVPKPQPPTAPTGPKAPRPPRERHPKGQAQPPPTAAPTASVSQRAATPTQLPASAPTAESSTAAAQPSARRTRPMLGLASRQFEAALSGAGVERKARREGEKEKERAPASDAAGGGASADAKPKEDRRGAQRVHAPPTILQREAQAPAPKILPRSVPGEAAPLAAPAESGQAGRGITLSLQWSTVMVCVSNDLAN